MWSRTKSCDTISLKHHARGPQSMVKVTLLQSPATAERMSQKTKQRRSHQLRIRLYDRNLLHTLLAAQGSHCSLTQNAQKAATQILQVSGPMQRTLTNTSLTKISTEYGTAPMSASEMTGSGEPCQEPVHSCRGHVSANSLNLGPLGLWLLQLLFSTCLP